MEPIKLLGIGSRVRHPEHGDGVIIQWMPTAYRITFMNAGIKDIVFTYPALEVIEAVDEVKDQLNFFEVNKILISILRKFSDVSEVVPMGQKWTGGKLILQPADKALVSKEVPIDTFFHKIVMLRDRLRVLEQKINASKALTDEEKVDIQQYITRCYGSLTTFNVLFANPKDHFVGEKVSKGD